MLRPIRPAPGTARFALAPLLLPTSAWAAIAGLPEPPTPRELPQHWVAFNDDMLGDAILDTDDYRTGNVNAGLTIGDLVIAGDYSAFTRRHDPGYTNGTRVDEATLTVGLRLDPHLPSEIRRRTLLLAGIGLRSDGDLGGELSQDAIHRTFSFPQAHLVYDRHSLSTTPLAWAYGSMDTAPWHPGTWHAALVGQLEGAALASARGEFQEHIGVSLSLIGEVGSAWLGCDYVWNGGRQATTTAAQVAEHESGTWINAGLAASNGIFLSAGVDAHTHGISGSVGYAAQAPSPPAAAGEIAAAGGDVKLTLLELEYFKGSGATGMRLSGAWFESADPLPLGGRLACAWFFDYHFGADYDYHWQGNRVDFDQLVLGPELQHTLGTSWLPRWLPLRLQGFADAGVGVRFERVKVVDAGQHRFNQDTGGALVVQPGAGARLRWCAEQDEAHPAWFNLLWLGYGYDYWIPLQHAPISNGSDHADYLRPGMGGHYSVGYSISW